ncbi:hypothetical protein CYMTET_30338, partial [Cymbomonas tetramitiformis]
DGPLLINGDAIMEMLDDQLVAVGALLNKPYSKIFDKQGRAWLVTVQETTTTMENLMACERQCLFLEPVFSSEHVQEQLPIAARHFKAVDTAFKKMIMTVRNERYVLAVCENMQLQKTLQDCNKRIENIMAELLDYLDRQRAAFPRFFFVSNTEMLAIMSHVQSPVNLERMLCKCFDSVHCLAFTEHAAVGSLVGLNEETLTFHAPAATKVEDQWGNLMKVLPVETWLQQTILMMNRTLQVQLAACLTEGGVPWWSERPDTPVSTLRTRHDLQQRHGKALIAMMRSYPGQLLLVVAQAQFTQQVEVAIPGGYPPMRRLLNDLQTQFQSMELLLTGAKPLPAREKQLCISIMFMVTYQRDVLQRLQSIDPQDDSDFEWQRLTRMYPMARSAEVGGKNQTLSDAGPDAETMHIEIRAMDNALWYGDEFISTHSRLVCSPLTERAGLSLIMAFKQYVGGCLMGPSGVGKTETAKDLARGCGKMCVLFNCSAMVEPEAISNFLKGLSASGCWGCLDDLDLLQLDVLSVCAQQLMSLQQQHAGVFSHGMSRAFTLEGTQLLMDPTFALTATINPGYQCRATLPENLKARFRPLAMLDPHVEFTTRVMLASLGFKFSRVLAGKLSACYKLASGLLSKAPHYDFGMRAVQATVRHMARGKNLTLKDLGVAAKRGAMKGKLLALVLNKGTNADLDRELRVLSEALHHTIMPTLADNDIVLFANLLFELLPQYKVPAPQHHAYLWYFIRHAIEAKGLRMVDPLVNKCLQMKCAMEVRCGIMLVGGAGAGKSTCCNVLGAALEELHQQTQRGTTQSKQVPQSVMLPEKGLLMSKLNPAALTLGHLFGCYRQNGGNDRRWQDGVFSNLIRTISTQESKAHWVVVDGPVSSVWIENLSTLLDESRLLCLANGERISTPEEQFSMIFEVSELGNVSPSIISRCGMVYFDNNVIGWSNIAGSAIDQLPFPLKMHQKLISSLYSRIFAELFSLMALAGAVVPMIESSMVLGHLKMMDVILSKAWEAKAEIKAAHRKRQSPPGLKTDLDFGDAAEPQLKDVRSKKRRTAFFKAQGQPVLLDRLAEGDLKGEDGPDDGLASAVKIESEDWRELQKAEAMKMGS